MNVGKGVGLGRGADVGVVGGRLDGGPVICAGEYPYERETHK